MCAVTKQQWEAYYLCHKDHQGLTYNEAAKKMGVNVDRVRILMMSMESKYPELFVDISSDSRRFDHGVSRFGPRCEGHIERKF